MTRLGFLSPGSSPTRLASASPLAGVDLGGVVDEITALECVEIRGPIEAYKRDSDDELLPIRPGRALLVGAGSPSARAGRIEDAGCRGYDMTSALTLLEIGGADLIARITDLDPASFPAAGSILRGTPALIDARGGGRFRLYVPRELARFVAEAIVDLARGLER